MDAYLPSLNIWGLNLEEANVCNYEKCRLIDGLGTLHMVRHDILRNEIVKLAIGTNLSLLEAKVNSRM